MLVFCFVQVTTLHRMLMLLLRRQVPRSSRSCSSSNELPMCPPPGAWLSELTARRVTSCRCCPSGKSLIITHGELD